MTKTEASEKARAMVKAGARLLDVRTPAEFAAGHIEGALNIPVQELAKRVEEVGPKEVPVVVYCQAGMRAANAAQILQKAGFREIFNLGPMSAW
jgi:phage shock protein E